MLSIFRRWVELVLGNRVERMEPKESMLGLPSSRREPSFCISTLVSPIFAPRMRRLILASTVKSNVRKRPYDAGGLGRQGAVRKRKEEIHEQNGHKFVQKQFYAVVLCALCGEFLLKGVGMQCEDCKYACHKTCYQKVVTKCISKSNAESVSLSFPLSVYCD